MTKKQVLAIICGGQSPEHQISLISAMNIATIARTNFLVILIGINKNGDWFLLDPFHPFLNIENPTKVCINLSKAIPISLIRKNGKSYLYTDTNETFTPDIYFPVLHGENGEDGSIQGMLQLFNVPYVGCGIAASANGMDKDLTKRLLQASNVNVTPGICIEPEDQINVNEITQKLGLPIFVKPARLGSSVGITKVKTIEDLLPAIQHAFTFDTKILLESNIEGREIECAVIGNRQPESSLPGEIIPISDYYSFDTKYVNDNGAILKCPAELTEEEIALFRQEACRTYRILGCSGMTRVDFFYTKNKNLIVNEVNTIPGFTKISMFPNLWEKTGISQIELIQKLIVLALEQYKEKNSLKRSND